MKFLYFGQTFDFSACFKSFVSANKRMAVHAVFVPMISGAAQTAHAQMQKVGRKWGFKMYFPLMG